MSAFLPFADAPISRFVDFRGLPSVVIAGLLCAGLLGEAPSPTFGQRAQSPACSEPSPCPATDTTKNPEVTCFEPTSSSVEKNVTLHIYGRHLTPDKPPKKLIYRDSEMSGPMARTNDGVEVKSACHVVTTLHVKLSRRLSAGDSVEFRLQREPPTRKARKEGSKGTVSDWHYVKLTPPQTPDRTLEVDPTAKAEQDSPCEVEGPAATAIGELSGRHHMNTVRLEGIVAETNAETGSDEKEYALRGETGTIRVTTSTSLPSVDTWYSVTGEVSPVDGEHLKEQDRTACK